MQLRDFKHHQKGSSLLEVLLATALFSIFIVSIWGIFQKVYWSYKETEQEVKLLEEGRMIMEFIQEEIRMAEGVTIQVEGIADVMQSKADVNEKLLKAIVLTRDRDNLSKPNNQDKLQLFASGKYKGYFLYYQKNEVAEHIREITVSRKKGSKLVELTCTMMGEEEEKNLSTQVVLSLEHKAFGIE